MTRPDVPVEGSLFPGGDRAFELQGQRRFGDAVSTALELSRKGSMQFIGSSVGDERYVVVVSKESFARLRSALRNQGVEYKRVRSASTVQLLEEQREARERTWIAINVSAKKPKLHNYS